MLVGEQITIGRDPGNQIVVPLPDVSRHHAQLISHDGGYAIIDLGSANGTHLRGKRIPSKQPVTLSDGDVIRIGDQSGNSISITYLIEEQAYDREGQTPLRFTSMGRIDLGQAQLGSLPRFTIGRDPNSNLTIDSPVVSWHHAEVVRSGSGYILNDLGSTNGSFLNGKSVRSIALNPGDEVQIGPYKLRYSPGGFQQLSSIGSVRLDGIQLCKEVPDKKGVKVILRDISLTVLPREFIALVGGSGAGKSTLIDALNGFRRVSSGKVMINGDDFYQHYDAYRSTLGYVPQSDILHTGLTVKRALRYIAMLRLPPDTARDMINSRMEAALQQVDMLPQIDQPISSLSGGQRKRVSIASELLPDPSLFFLDEPTSGLDPGLDKKMMNTLRLLADGGHTILLTTHATSNIIGQCDHVAFLSYGQLVYFGPPAQAIHFFNVTDFADIYSKLETHQDADKWEKAFKASPDYQKFVTSRQQELQLGGTGIGGARAKPPRLSLSAYIRQFNILSMRYLDLILNDTMSMFILLAVMPIIGLLLLMIANSKSLVGDTSEKIGQILALKGIYNIVGETQKLLFMLALGVILLGLFASAYELIKERPVYRRERMVNLRIGPYIFSKMAVLMGFGLLQCAALLLVIGIKVDYPSQGVFLPVVIEIYISLVLALAAGLAMGLFISAMVKNNNMVVYLVLVGLFIQLIFSGVLFSVPKFGEALAKLTPTRWAMEGLGASVNIEALNELSKTYIHDADGILIQKERKTPVTFNINYARSLEHLLLTWGMQILFVVLFLSLTAVMLRSQDVHT